MRFGLFCLFKKEPVSFRTTTRPFHNYSISPPWRPMKKYKKYGIVCHGNLDPKGGVYHFWQTPPLILLNDYCLI
ncbi:MAG: hypothetical protein K4571_09975 [Deltaproteobacteria bacterium]